MLCDILTYIRYYTFESSLCMCARLYVKRKLIYHNVIKLATFLIPGLTFDADYADVKKR